MKKISGFVAIILTILIACQNEESEFVQLPKPDVAFSEFTDERDGNVYKCITIGDQTWMAENLRYRIPGGVLSGCFTYEENGKIMVTTNMLNAQFDRAALSVKMETYMLPFLIPIMGNDFQASMFFYGMFGMRIEGGESAGSIMYEMKVDFDSNPDDPWNPWPIFEPHEKQLDSLYTEAYNEAYKKAAFVESDRLADFDYAAKRGYFYRFQAVNSALPEGWRLPSDEDWKILEKNLGMDPAELNLMEEWRGAGTGTLLKEGPDGIGFNAQLNGGCVFGIGGATSNFMRQGLNAYYWSSTLMNTSDTVSRAVIRNLHVYQNKILRGVSNVVGGVSEYPAYNIRCIKMKDGEIIKKE